MCHSSLCFLDFVVTLYANAGEEAQVIPIEDVDKKCLYKEAASGRVFELVHILGVPETIRKYARRALRSLTDEEKKNYLQAVEAVQRLYYKKPQEFSPVPAALQTMWQARQNKSSIAGIPWPFHNLRLRYNLAFIQDQQPMPTRPNSHQIKYETHNLLKQQKYKTKSKTQLVI
jgi:hypothetical protein